MLAHTAARYCGRGERARMSRAGARRPCRAAPVTVARPPVAGTKRFVRACGPGRCAACSRLFRPAFCALRALPRRFSRRSVAPARRARRRCRGLGPGCSPLVAALLLAPRLGRASARAPRLRRSAARRAFALSRALAARAALRLALRASAGLLARALARLRARRLRRARGAGSPSGRPFGLWARRLPPRGASALRASFLRFAPRGFFCSRGPPRCALAASPHPLSGFYHTVAARKAALGLTGRLTA